MDGITDGAFSRQVARTAPAALRTESDLLTMQLNIGRACNLRCKHCHVSGDPENEGAMSRETMADCLRAFRRGGFRSLDITGGAPELNPNLPWLLREAVAAGAQVMIRTNLVILTEAGGRAFPALYKECGAAIVGSLPYYNAKNTDRMRGAGVFERSVAALRQLNALGYGHDPRLALNLVYNPGGAFLPPEQSALEREYRERLRDGFGVVFNSLFAIANNPVGRFAAFLEKSGNLAAYMERLAAAFNPAAALNMMCRRQISVDWAGRVYDCDFNQALGWTVNAPADIAFYGEEAPSARPIRFGGHCYACTAGSGSSCGGATA
jgi:radical SAM/Cys-rich protein